MKATRGRPEKEAVWSRLISLSSDDLRLLRSYLTKDDLEEESRIVTAMEEPDDGIAWEPCFWPDSFAD